MTNHKSDCAVHNEPAMKAGPCDCGAGIVETMARAIEAAEDAWLVQAGDALDGLQEEPEFSLPETKSRAALTAALDHMREPSMAMREEGSSIGDDALDRWGSDSMGDCSTFTSESAQVTWQAMLDQLRKDELG